MGEKNGQQGIVEKFIKSLINSVFTKVSAFFLRPKFYGLIFAFYKE